MEAKRITLTEWKEGLIDVCGFLRIELIQFLKDEGRYHGRVKSFMNNIRDAVAVLESQTTEDEIEVYGRVLSVIRNTISSEFRRLGYRRLSPADRVIVLIHRIVEILENDTVNENFRYQRELGIIKKVIDKLFDNIRTRGKMDELPTLTDLIKRSMETERCGKFRCDVLDLYHVEHPAPKEMTLTGPETLLNSGPKATEISL